ncbi:Uu.00g015830.m01.CDS01 [Anthostomella pinea]|uniref:Uu.00g015830.m01.CDS01 n=1 Tax=Anthostomella pinea TaxID=933095 RepID=A0AAI8VYK9_9PEZI|nr:Uu.00g015830.m01.CDS01 [Anthostomella pinea]
MATTSSQPSANAANTPTIGAARASSTSLPAPSESPSIPGPSPSLAAAAPNGGTNGYFVPTATSNDGPTTVDLRLYPRDGRVRNPVPSKLKDVAEQMKGNFGVMHMDVTSHRASEGRDAAAKRTSESTALQAKMAQTDTYVSHQRRANYPRPPGLKQFTPPSKSTEPGTEPVAKPGPRLPLAVEDTKAEQARLLTLLRTLPHHTVVDQLCKALAFFGGIPDAPPPVDGNFPESAGSNGSGSLFVGWIAEIFPDLDRPPRPARSTPTQTTGLRRPRGRPKGSKASKARSDKGFKKGPLKKGPQKALEGADNQPADPADESWVDVEESVLQLNGAGDLANAEGALRDALGTPSLTLDGESATAAPATGSNGGFRSINHANNAPASSAKRRGRPKGSKNRSKDTSVLQQASQSVQPATANANSSAPPASTPILPPPPPKVTPVPVPVPMLDTQSKKKSSATKPKAPRNRSKATKDVTVKNSTLQPQQPAGLNSSSSTNVTNTGSGDALSLTDGFVPSTINGGASHVGPGQTRAQDATSSGQVPAQQVKPSSVTAKKRKRQTAKDGASASKDNGSVPTGGNEPLSLEGQPSIPQGLQAPSTQSQPIQQAVPSISPAPPAKRARKSQELTTQATRPTPNVIGQNGTIPSPHVATEHVQQPNQIPSTTQDHTAAQGLEAHYAAMQSYNNHPQNKMQQQPPASMGTSASPTTASVATTAEGLEAHYERFAALQNYSDTTRSTSTRPQKPQQQTTQRASPIPAQTSKTPQMPATLASQQQARAPQSYYPQSQVLAPFSTQQPSYSTSQRQQQHMASGSPNTGLVQHVTNSPQFSAQSNSPLMQPDNSYRGSPSLIHGSTAFVPRRTPTASPLERNPYRPTSTTNHGVPSHSPHFGTRQTPTTTTSTHNTSHSGLSSTFPSFADSSFLDIQSLDSGTSHSSLGLGTGAYGLGSGSVPQQQRTTSSSTAPLYSPVTGLNNSYMGPSSIGRASHNHNRWP